MEINLENKILQTGEKKKPFILSFYLSFKKMEIQ